MKLEDCQPGVRVRAPIYGSGRVLQTRNDHVLDVQIHFDAGTVGGVHHTRLRRLVPKRDSLKARVLALKERAEEGTVFVPLGSVTAVQACDALAVLRHIAPELFAKEVER